MNIHLSEYLSRSPEERKKLARSLPIFRTRRWRVRDRLGKDKIALIVAAFNAGTPKHVLAKRYGIAERSLKKLLCEEGVKRRSWNDIQA